MLTPPKLQRVSNLDLLKEFGETYFKCSGLAIPENYLHDPNNRIYALYFKKQMVGGFILGQGDALRTVEVFAQETLQRQMYENLGDVKDFTEITCFWICPKHRRNTKLNTFIWISLAYCLKRYGNKNILFGTCSTSLARLYGVTPKSRLIHQDFVNGKRTYVFQSERRTCLQGFMQILRFKFSRTATIRKQKRQKSLFQAA